MTSPSDVGGGGAVAPPRPSLTLLAQIAMMQPVRPRRPARSLLVVVLVTGVCAAWTLTTQPLRPDLGGSIAGVVGVGALWLAGFIVPLTLAILPRPGQIIPDGKRAFRAAWLTALLLIGASLLLAAEAFGGGRSTVPSTAASLRPWHACVIAGLKVSTPVIVAGALALRRVAILDTWRLGAALGAAGGALAGLTLHLACSNDRPAHVALAHGGGIVIGAVAGALSLLLSERVAETLQSRSRLARAVGAPSAPSPPSFQLHRRGPGERGEDA